jgi:peptidoglycan/LPS O-acetylase OafA/YrhL
LLDIRSYAWRRFRRLYPPLLVALCTTALFDYVGTRVDPGFYAGLTSYPLINNNLGGESHSLTTLLGNLLLQSSFAVPVFGSDGPLWSLAFEFWFYVLYPVLLILSVRCGTKRTAVIVLALSTAGFLVPHPFPWMPGWILQVLTYWIIWVAGSLLADAYVARSYLPGSRLMVPVALLGLAALAVVTLRSGELTSGNERVNTALDLGWSAGLGLLLAYVVLSPSQSLSNFTSRIARHLVPLGNMSYSLYVVHFPWLALLSASWLASHVRLPLGIELAVPGAISALALAACCWYLVERHFVRSHGVETRVVRRELVKEA